MRLKAALFFSLILLFLAAPAQAAEPVAGGSCSTYAANAYMIAGGPGNTFGMLKCIGNVWVAQSQMPVCGPYEIPVQMPTVGWTCYCPNQSTFGGTWVSTGATSRNYQGIFTSADGQKVVALVDNGQIYTSTNGGSTWTARDSARTWGLITGSPDGTKLAATVDNGYIYTSTDSGATWTAQTGSGTRYWSGISGSDDMTTLIASVDNGSYYSYISTNSGVTWTALNQAPLATADSFADVASSSDGRTLALSKYAGPTYTSANGGTTWTLRSAGINASSVCMSADGTRIIVAPTGTPGGGLSIAYSSNSGSSFSTVGTSAGNFYNCAMSGDGKKALIVSDGGQIYSSTDGGATWAARDSNRAWRSVATTPSGSVSYATVYGGSIYKSVSCSAP